MIGIVMLYFVLLICSSVAAQSSMITSTEVGQVQGLMQPTGTDSTSLTSGSVIGQAVSLITNVWSYLLGFLQIVFLWFPNLWTGTWLWFYFIVCVPISVGFVMSIVFVLRGVHSG